MTTCIGKWNQAPLQGALHLQAEEAHIWQFVLDSTQHQMDGLRALLSDDELAKAQRLVTRELEERSIAAHAALRLILSRYTQTAPQALRFSKTQHGKPYLLANAHDVQFNLSHSHNRALVAVTRQVDVGIDLERSRDQRDIIALATRFFCTSEADALKQLADDQQAKAFYHLWCRKEAVLKATGLGLSAGLKLFQLHRNILHKAKIEKALSKEVMGPWVLHDLTMTRPYTAAIAIRCTACRIHCWNWDLSLLAEH